MSNQTVNIDSVFNNLIAQLADLCRLIKQDKAGSEHN